MLFETINVVQNFYFQLDFHFHILHLNKISFNSKIKNDRQGQTDSEMMFITYCDYAFRNLLRK